MTFGSILLLALTVLGISRVYIGDQRETSERLAAEATYAADTAAFENARDEYNRCQQRVESSDKLADLAEAEVRLAQGVLATFRSIEELLPPDSRAREPLADIVDRLSEDVDQVVVAASAYDRVDPATCPPMPVEPVRPPSLGGPED